MPNPSGNVPQIGPKNLRRPIVGQFENADEKDAKSNADEKDVKTLIKLYEKLDVNVSFKKLRNTAATLTVRTLTVRNSL